MSTNSSISIQLKDKTILSVYCHWDGHLSYNGLRLFKYYRNKKKVEKLIKHGFISSLQKRVDPIVKTHNFYNYQEDTTVFYNRDRGDKLEINKINSIKEIKNFYSIYTEFHYLFKNNRWFYSEYGIKWKKLKKEDLK
jgi:hypothetical protein